MPYHWSTDARGTPPAPAAVGLLVCRLHALSHGFEFEARHIHLAGVSGNGDPDGSRMGEEDRWRAFRRREAVDGPDRLAHLPDWPVGPAGHIRRTQIALPTRFSPPVWTLAVAAGLTSLAPLWSWLRGRDRLTMGLAVTTVYGQLLVLLLCAFPQVAVGLSGRDLADYYNRTRELPSRILMTQDRVGSVVFYLDRELRSQLQLGQIANQNINAPLPSPALGREEWVVIPERHLHTALIEYDLASLPYERAGRFRLYRRSDMEPRATGVDHGRQSR